MSVACQPDHSFVCISAAARFEIFIEQADRFKAMAKDMYEKAAANVGAKVETVDWPSVTSLPATCVPAPSPLLLLCSFSPFE